MHIVPRETQRFLKRFGGLTPYGHPRWRLVVSSERLIKESGRWTDWAEGLTTKEKGGMDFTPIEGQPGMVYERFHNKPLRVVVEVRETPKYPHVDGWILESWFPASSYGAPEEWYSYKADDGITPMLGPYPECGDYEMQFGPWVKLPTTDILQAMISRHCSSINNRQGTPFTRAVEHLNRTEYTNQKKEEKLKAEYEARFRDVLSPMKSTSLEASRWRQDLAKRTGNENQHIGV